MAYSFGQPRTELRFGGHAFGKGLEFFMNMGWGRFDPDNLISGTPHLMSFSMWEAWLQFKLTQNFQIKIGQFTLPFSRESLIRAENQLAVEKTTIDHRLGLAESEIIEFDWASDSKRFKLALSNGSGALFHSSVATMGRADPTPALACIAKRYDLLSDDET